jgi:hypothetical protein
MCPASSERVTKLLINWGHGNLDTRDALIPLVYGELCQVARPYLGRQRPVNALESAASVPEVGISAVAVKRERATARALLQRKMKSKDAGQ